MRRRLSKLIMGAWLAICRGRNTTPRDTPADGAILEELALASWAAAKADKPSQRPTAPPPAGWEAMPTPVQHLDEMDFSDCLTPPEGPRALSKRLRDKGSR